MAEQIDAPVFRLGHHPRRTDHPALLDQRGEAVCTWAVDESREEIAAILKRGGYVLHDDDTVTARGSG